jgi:predicted DNA-binding protein
MKRFSLLLGLSAILISVVAGFFSITGIAMLFIGHFIPVIIMGCSLEFAKLIIASFLYRYWEDVTKTIRYYLLLGLLILMLITSGGIFGFLSDAYNKSAGTVKVIDTELVMMQKQKESKISEIERYQNRIIQLSDIRSQQEKRIDSLYSKGWTTSAKVVQSSIKAATNDMEQYNSKIESLQKDIGTLDGSIISKETQVLSSDVGPLRYMANVFNTDMDTVVKWFILLLIFVFDPIAVTLIVAFNITLYKDGKKTFGLTSQSKEKMTDEQVNKIFNESIIQGKKMPQEIIERITANSNELDEPDKPLEIKKIVNETTGDLVKENIPPSAELERVVPLEQPPKSTAPVANWHQ